MKILTEDNIERFAIEILQGSGWEYVHGLAIAPGAEQSERESFQQIILIERLRKTSVGAIHELRLQSLPRYPVPPQ